MFDYQNVIITDRYENLSLQAGDTHFDTPFFCGVQRLLSASATAFLLTALRRHGRAAGLRLFAARFALVAVFSHRCIVVDFLESLDDGRNVCLVGIVSDGDGLLLHIGLNPLYAFLEAQVVLDSVLAALAVHLRLRG